MIRRQRMKLLRITLTGLAVVATIAALVPAIGTSHAQAASAPHSAAAKRPPTPAQLEAIAIAAEKRAAAATKVAAENKVAAATAEANLRQAEANFDAIRGSVPTPALRVRPLTPLVPSIQSNYATTAAQTGDIVIGGLDVATSQLPSSVVTTGSSNASRSADLIAATIAFEVRAPSA